LETTAIDGSWSASWNSGNGKLSLNYVFDTKNKSMKLSCQSMTVEKVEFSQAASTPIEIQANKIIFLKDQNIEFKGSDWSCAAQIHAGQVMKYHLRGPDLEVQFGGVKTVLHRN
jgi:hypothetical protein